MILTIVAVLTAITLAFGLVGIIVRYMLVPYLRDQLVTQLLNPVQETHRQVTVNQHSSEEPTILDKMDDLKKQISGVGEKLDQHLITHRWR